MCLNQISNTFSGDGDGLIRSKRTFTRSFAQRPLFYPLWAQKRRYQDNNNKTQRWSVRKWFKKILNEAKQYAALWFIVYWG